MNEREEEKDNQPQANAYNALSLIKNATIFFCYIVVYMHVHMYVCGLLTVLLLRKVG